MLYANTFYSLVDRLDETGYLEESFVPGRYPGCFARSVGAYVFLMTQAGEVELAVRALRFVLDSMRRADLPRPSACAWEALLWEGRKAFAGAGHGVPD